MFRSNGPSNRTATTYMLVAVICYSTVPLFVTWGDGDGPFLFGALWRVGHLLGAALFLALAYRPLLLNLDNWKAISRRSLSRDMLLWIVCYSGVAWFAWSAELVDISVTAVLYETWPIILIALTGRLFKREARYRAVSKWTFTLPIMAFVGFVFVVLSQSGGFASFGESSLITLAFGVSLALAASAATSLNSFGFRWGASLAKDLPVRHRYERDSLELFGNVVGSLVSHVFAIPALALAGFARGESVNSETVMFGVLGGALAAGAAGIVWRKANLMTRDLRINAIAYATPALALIWLLALSIVGDVRLDYLLIGAALTVAANVFIYFDVEVAPRRSAERSETVDVAELIAAGESERVEFKSTLRTNTYTGEVDRRITDAALKSIAAFMNTNGGTLIVGVADDGAPIGIDFDNFRNEDQALLFTRNVVSDRIDALAMASYITLRIADYRGSRALLVHCRRSAEPMFVKSSGREQFYIRTGPSTTEPDARELLRYVNERF